MLPIRASPESTLKTTIIIVIFSIVIIIVVIVIPTEPISIEPPSSSSSSSTATKIYHHHRHHRHRRLFAAPVNRNMAVIVIEMFDIDGFSGDKTGASSPLCHPLSVDTFVQQQHTQ